jgi:hypothetical protein
MALLRESVQVYTKPATADQPLLKSKAALTHKLFTAQNLVI